MQAMAPASAKRTDIQVLRAWAVGLVLLHHADLPVARAGYLGVDIFFVISGFLMTRLIGEGVRERTFSFRAFYFRRAKRLLPASLTVVLICLVLSAFLMEPSLQPDFLKTALGAATFTTNHVLASQAGYFDASAELAPLLHYWSLAVEEQYYFVIPLVLFFCPVRFWKWVALAGAAASFALCLVVAQKSPTTAFYILPTRAWEMGIGSLAAILFTGERSVSWAQKAFYPALALILVVPVIGVGQQLGLTHPGLESLVVCLATMTLLIASKSPSQSSAAVRVAGSIGDASYSLYLAHWPFFAFARMAWPGELPLEVRLVLLGCAIIAGILLYRFVERPIHRARFTRAHLLGIPLIVGSLAVAAFSAAPAPLRGSGGAQIELRRENVGLSSACHGDLASERWTRECRSSLHPRVLVWGDSHAMHLASGVADTVDGGVVQATMPACPPTQGLSWFDAGMSEANARDCIAFNKGVLKLIAAEPSIEVVVLAGALHAYFLDGVRTYSERDGAITVDAEHVVSALKQTVSDLRRLGKRVVFLKSPPTADFDVGLCLERKALGLLLAGPLASCDIPREMARERASEASAILAALGQQADLPVISLDEALCDDVRCRTMLKADRLYRDNSHLSIGGGKALARQLNLGALIEKVAR